MKFIVFTEGKADQTLAEILGINPKEEQLFETFFRIVKSPYPMADGKCFVILEIKNEDYLIRYVKENLPRLKAQFTQFVSFAEMIKKSKTANA